MSTVHQLILQHGRDEARRLARDATGRRLVDIAAEVLAEANGAMGFTYSGFCQTALPHKRLPDDQEWQRKSGRLTLMIEPGKLLDQHDRPRLYGVPYGSRARLILLYLQTRAIQTNCQEIELGRSMREWLERMGIPPGGQTYRDVRDQANRISACRLTFSWSHGDGKGFTRDSIVDGGIVLHDSSLDDRQGRLWIDTVRLSNSFFKALKEHPVPLWEPAIKLISNNSLALDIYTWLAYRLHHLDGTTPITWLALHGQFGGGYKAIRQFKPRFLESLEMARAVYPNALVELDEHGLILHPSHSPMERRLLALG